MFSARITQTGIRFLDWINQKAGRGDPRPAHQRTGSRGEEHAYFYLRRLGYVMVARNFRSPRRRGEIDLIGWENDVLCFIEVKTRTSRDVKPAEAAVDRAKQRELLAVAQEYLRQMPTPCSWRCDVVSVYYGENGKPQFEVFKDAVALS